MTTVTSETSIGRLHKNCYLMEKHSNSIKSREDVHVLRQIFLLGKMSKFLAVGWDSPPISRVSHEGLGEGGSPHLVGATKQHQRKMHFQ